MCKQDQTKVLNQSLLSSINMLSNGVEVELIEARIQNTLEIAQGFGIELNVPIGRKRIFSLIGRRIFGNINDNL